MGYFVLGPTELYKLTKEIGKALQNFRSLSTEASKQFETSMEDQLDLQELRKAQRELDDAFNFRRSINTDETAEAFDTAAEEATRATEEAARAAEMAAASGTAAAAVGTKKRKVKRRKKVKKVEDATPAVATADEYASDDVGTGGQVPDLDMSDAFPTEASSDAGSDADAFKPDWFDDRGIDQLKGEKQQDSLFGDNDPWAESKADEQSRFAAQLSKDWNDSVVANEDKLSPLSKIMERLAILEEEKKASDLRLEEEFRMRGEMEEKFYRQKRELLREASAEVQAEAFVGMAEKSEDGADAA